MTADHIADLSNAQISRLSTRERRGLARVLLQAARREGARLRVTRGAYRRTARARQRVRRWLVVAAFLAGVAVAGPSFAAAPEFDPPQLNPHGISNSGTYASPSFADIDGDGDLDLFVGVGANDAGGGVAYGKTMFMENQGSASVPAFGAAQTNPFGLVSVGTFHGPALGDIDDDGDLDMFVGVRSGDLVYQGNSGSASVPAFGAPQTNPFGLTGLGVDTYALPALGDIDGDGDLDMLVGNLAGDVVFFENNGTASTPAFGSPETNPFGLQRVAAGSGAPTFDDVDHDGDLDAFSGDLDGNAVFFENIGTASTPLFTDQLTNRFGMQDVGKYSAPCFGDIDGDGDLDALIGADTGDLFLFEMITPKRLIGACAVAPEVGCETGFEKAQLKISEKTAGKESIQAKMLKGPTIVSFGNPSVPGPDYALCIYNGTDALVASVDIDATGGETCDGKPCWKEIGGGKGLLYGDKGGAADGVTQLKLMGGATGKTQIQLKAANDADNQLPTGVASALQTTASVKVQFTSPAGCHEAEMVVIKKAAPDEFQAQ